jgi:rod shape-determining protein MreD
VNRYLRLLVMAVLVVVAVTLQVSVFSHFAVEGVVPDVALLLVIATAIVRGPNDAALVGFVAGLILDLAPPSDHTAGRWALSLVIVGYLTGLARPDNRVSKVATLAMAAAGAFIGTSVFAITGLVLRDPDVTIGAVFDVVPRAVAYDVVLTPLVVPLLILVLRRVQPAERW